MSAPARLLIRFLLTIAVVWGLSVYLPDYFTVTGSWTGYVTIAALITLLNLFIRPILTLLSFPFRLFAHLLTLILVNALFLWLVMWFVNFMDPSIVSLHISGGIVGWVVVSILLGLANWIMKEALHGKRVVTKIKTVEKQ